MLAGHGDQLPPVRVAERPQLFVADLPDQVSHALQPAEPAFLAAGLGPNSVGRFRIPRGDVDAVGDVADRNLGMRPPREEALEEASTHIAVQPADPVDRGRGRG
jgi:hypothetical protein